MRKLTSATDPAEIGRITLDEAPGVMFLRPGG